MEILFRGSKGDDYRIDSNPFAYGAEGNIYSIVGNSSIVAKIYKREELDQLEEKIKLMINRPLADVIMNSIAWPVDILYGLTGAFCGYVMPKMDITHELNEVYVYPPRIGIPYKLKLILAQNICAVIHELHRVGYVLGDFNPRNIGVNLNTGGVAFLDTDSYHIVIDKASNRAYRCNVCAPGYAAPEFLKKCDDYISAHPEDKRQAYAKTPLDTFTKETDNFALAIHMFRLLMNGYTPFNGIPEDQSPSEGSPGLGDNAVRRDSYCFKKGNKPQAAAVPHLDSLPESIQEFFTRAFIDGKTDPKRRPSALEWHRAIEGFEKELIICSFDPVHMYRTGLKSCPLCEAATRYSTMMTAGIPFIHDRFENADKESRKKTEKAQDDLDKNCDDWVAVENNKTVTLPESVSISKDPWMWGDDNIIESVRGCEAFKGFSEESMSDLISILFESDKKIENVENNKKRFYEILDIEFKKKIKDDDDKLIEKEIHHYLKRYIRSSEDFDMHLVCGIETLYMASIYGIWQLYRGEDYTIEDVRWYKKPSTVAFIIKSIHDDKIMPMFCCFTKKHHVIHQFSRSQPIENEQLITSNQISDDDWM